MVKLSALRVAEVCDLKTGVWEMSSTQLDLSMPCSSAENVWRNKEEHR